MAVEFLVNRLKTLFVLLLGALRRAMCCFRRRRRSSCDSVPLSAVGVIPNAPELEQWDQWGESPIVVVSDKPVDPIQEKIQQYRQQIAQKPEMSEEEKQSNFFENMTPRITRQHKVVIRQKNSQSQSTLDASKFAVATEPMPTNELGEWEENTAGWEGETVEEFGDATAVIREEKRREREERLFKQHQKRMERSIRPQALGAKISS